MSSHISIIFTEITYTMKSILAALLIILFSLSSCSNKNSKVSERPNIILIMTDDVDFKHWSCYGDELPTPHIENLARQGMVFHQAYTTSAACTPSRYSIMTGQYAGRCKDESFLSGNPDGSPYLIAWNTPLTEENLTMHELMKEAGYQTGFVGKFHLGSLQFDNPYFNPLMPEIDPDLSPDTKEADSLLRIYQDLMTARVKVLTGTDFAGAIQWENPETLPLKAIRKHNLEYQVWGVRNFFRSLSGSQPFFLTINSTAMHGPNHFESLLSDPVYTAEGRIGELRNVMPSRSSIFERLHDLGWNYGEGVSDHINHYLAGRIYMDDQVGAIMQMLSEFGYDKNTLVILTADHNIEPGKSTVYSQGVNVPFVAWWPDHIDPGTQSYDHIQFIDFLPTFAELGGAGISSDQIIDGKSFADVFKGPQLVDDRILYYEEGYSRGVSNGKYKYIAIRFPERIMDSLASGSAITISQMGTKRTVHSSISMEYYPFYFDADQLYDLENDPYEQVNLASDPKYRKILEEMKKELQLKLETFEHPFDLSDNEFNHEDAYRNAASKARSAGTGWIPWWNRKLDFPPE